MKIGDILSSAQYDEQNPPQLLEAFDAEMNWCGDKRRALFARITFVPNSSDSQICWRLEGDDGAWCLAYGQIPHNIANVWNEKEDSIKKWLGLTHSAIGTKAFCRLFFLESTGYYVSVNAGFGTFYENFDGPSASFYLRWGNIKNWRCSETRSAFETILNDPQSDACFAQKLLKSPDIPAEVLAFGFEYETQYRQHREQFKSLVTMALWNSDSLWEYHHQFYVNVTAREIGPHSHLKSIVISNPKIQHIALSKQDVFWLNLIKYFGPLDVTSKRLHKYSLQKIMTIISFQVSAPTAHEQLEAKLKLHEWAKAGLSPEKYAEVVAMERQP